MDGTERAGRTTLAAIVEQKNAAFVLRDVILSAPRADEVIVQIEASGMCHADLAGRAGDFPFPFPAVFGHEGVGHVVEIGGAVTDVAVGDRVVMSFAWCGLCPACQRANQAYCRDWPRLNLVDGSRADGSATLSCDDGPLHGHFFGQSSFARYVVTAARATVKVPEDLSAAVLAPLGCGIQTGVGAATTVLRPGVGARVAVFGAGAVGLSAIMGLGLTGAAQIICVDVNPQRLELARELGATHIVNAATADSATQIAALTQGDGLDGAIESSGNPSALGAAVAALAAGGTCVVVGVPGNGEPLSTDVINLVSRGLKIIGTNQGDAIPRVFIPHLIELYRRGKLPIERLITEFDLSDINEAATASLNGSAIKPVLHMR